MGLLGALLLVMRARERAKARDAPREARRTDGQRDREREREEQALLGPCTHIHTLLRIDACPGRRESVGTVESGPERQRDGERARQSERAGQRERQRRRESAARVESRLERQRAETHLGNGGQGVTVLMGRGKGTGRS